MAIFAARLFEFCPPQDVANDPRVFLAGVVELFEHYPAEIVERAVSVVHGLPSKYKFAPRIAEIKEFLENLMAPIRRQEARDRVAEERDRSLPPPIDRANRPTYEELKARCAEAGLIIGHPSRGVNPTNAAAEFRERHGVSIDVWNAIPDAKL